MGPFRCATTNCMDATPPGSGHASPRRTTACARALTEPRRGSGWLVAHLVRWHQNNPRCYPLLEVSQWLGYTTGGGRRPKREKRILRNGSHINDARNARSARRHAFPPAAASPVLTSVWPEA